MAKKATKSIASAVPGADDRDIESPEVPQAKVVTAEDRDPYRGVKAIGFVFVVLCGWAFVIGSNKFHITAPVVFVCLGFLALMFTVVNLWRTGAAAAGPVELDADWARPIGARGELEKEKRTLLKGIKEAEFDAAMGKLSKADSESLIREYRGRAIEVIKEIDRLDAGNALSPKEQIAREVKARIALAAQDKPSNRAKNAVAARAAGKGGTLVPRAEKPETAEPDAADETPDEVPVEPIVETAEDIAAKAKAEAEAKVAADQIGDRVAAEAAAKIAAADAKVAAADAAEAKAAAARAEADAAEAKAEAAKAAVEDSKSTAGERA